MRYAVQLAAIARRIRKSLCRRKFIGWIKTVDESRFAEFSPCNPHKCPFYWYLHSKQIPRICVGTDHVSAVYRGEIVEVPLPKWVQRFTLLYDRLENAGAGRERCVSFAIDWTFPR